MRENLENNKKDVNNIEVEEGEAMVRKKGYKYVRVSSYTKKVDGKRVKVDSHIRRVPVKKKKN